MLTGALILLAVALGGALVSVSGVVPIAASSGHWAVTEWFLHFNMKRSVTTWSLGIEPPPLDDEGLVIWGAGAYHGNCAFCHGSPESRMPVVPSRMTPPPPELAARIPEWDADELFYIAKHGIKFAGMPAWPTQQRDDEVWAMVAFLEQYPSLDARGYDRLVHGDTPLAAPGAPEVVVEVCARCHGMDGLGRGEGVFPKLAGQQVAYLEAALVAYASGERHSGVMQPIAARLSEQQMREAARYYGDLPPGAIDGVVGEPDAIARGEAIALGGVPELRIPACAHCHGPKDGPRNPHYPYLAGQYEEYLVTQLELFEKGHRGGSPYAEIMRTVAAHALEPEHIDDVAAYYASLPTARR